MPWNRATRPPFFHISLGKANNISALQPTNSPYGCPHPLDNALLLWYYWVQRLLLLYCLLTRSRRLRDGCFAAFSGWGRETSRSWEVWGLFLSRFQEARPREAKQFQLEV